MDKQTLFQKLLNEENYKNEIKTEGTKHSIKLKILLIFATLFILTFFFVFQINTNNLAQSSNKDFIWQEPDLIAEHTFPVYKDDEQISREKRDAVSKVPPVYNYDRDAEETAELIIENTTDYLRELTEDASASLFELSTENRNIILEMSSREKNRLADDIKKHLLLFTENIYKNGFIDQSVDKINNNHILVHVNPTDEYILKTDFITDRSLFIEKADKYFSGRFNETAYEICMSVINNMILPNLIENNQLTEELKQLTSNAVPKTIGFVEAGSVIVKKGEVVDEETLRKIKSYQKIKWNMDDSAKSLFFLLGNFGHTLLLYSILLLFLFVMRKKIFYDNIQMVIISSILVLSSLLSWLSVEIQSGYPLEYLVFIPAFAMLISVVFDSRTAFYVTLIMSLLLMGIRGNDYATGISMLFAGTLAAYTVKDIQNRTQMFQSMFYIFIGLLISILIFSAQQSLDWSLTYQKLLIALVNSAISPLITFGLIIILEKVSSITTDLKIKEFDNLDHPLLVKLSEVAPGTYQHSIGVANLAERCARRVNGNPLLVKVGAYFHDIGKMVKPEYFTENQINMENKHDLLPPKKSAQIIREHVIDGIEMAKQYKLPQRLINFIATHHGSTLIKHFYAQAIEDSEEVVHQDDFRYPGPKPSSLDEAIVMICDSAEAIARVVAKSESEVVEILEEHLKNLLLDGQFDHCNITMEEIQIVKDTIYKNLKGLSHQRVSYKKIPTDKLTNK